METQGKTSCSNGDLIYDATTCKNACDELSVPRQQILGGYVCYKDSKGKCYQDGYNGGGASMVCKKSGSAHPPSTWKLTVLRFRRLDLCFIPIRLWALHSILTGYWNSASFDYDKSLIQIQTYQKYFKKHWL